MIFCRICVDSRKLIRRFHLPADYSLPLSTDTFPIILMLYIYSPQPRSLLFRRLANLFVNSLSSLFLLRHYCLSQLPYPSPPYLSYPISISHIVFPLRFTSFERRLHILLIYYPLSPSLSPPSPSLIILSPFSLFILLCRIPCPHRLCLFVSTESSECQYPLSFFWHTLASFAGSRSLYLCFASLLSLVIRARTMISLVGDFCPSMLKIAV